MVKRNGFYSNGRQRWFCHLCKHSFHCSNLSNKRRKEYIWFQRWVYEAYSARQLSQQSGHSQAKIYRIIDYWLARLPREDNPLIRECRHAIFDGTFLHRPKSIVAIMDGSRNEVIRGQYDIRENSEPQLRSFLEPLKGAGLSLKSCTVDGNPQAIRVLRALWPGVILQRCLVHIQRQGIMWCRQKPRRTDARHLRNLFSCVTNIDTNSERRHFLHEFTRWEKHFGQQIDTQPERGRVFSDIKRARSMLQKALPDMFHYLKDSNIPRTTNGLEGYFSRLKDHYGNHRGLKPQKRNHYFKWYFYLRKK